MSPNKSLRMDPALETFGRWLFCQEATFIRGVEKIDSLPPPSVPEVAFIGRSNVGKSSLINTLLNRKALARVSHTPGRTQQLNFFFLGKKIYIVDMPGYGYAAVPKTKLKLFSSLIETYLRGRAPLKRAFLLIDSRHGVKPSDLNIMTLLDKAAVSYQLVLTKVDKCSTDHLQEMEASLQKTLKKHPAAFPIILPCSSVTKEGISLLQVTIGALVFENNTEESIS